MVLWLGLCGWRCRCNCYGGLRCLFVLVLPCAPGCLLPVVSLRVDVEDVEVGVVEGGEFFEGGFLPFVGFGGVVEEGGLCVHSSLYFTTRGGRWKEKKHHRSAVNRVVVLFLPVGRLQNRIYPVDSRQSLVPVSFKFASRKARTRSV